MGAEPAAIPSGRILRELAKESQADVGESKKPAERQRTATPWITAGGPPVTEGALKSLLDDLRRNIVANIAVFREEINEVLIHLHDTELTTAAHDTQITKLESELSALKHEQAQIHNHMATMEDRRQWKNVKVQGPGRFNYNNRNTTPVSLCWQAFSLQNKLNTCYWMYVTGSQHRRQNQQ
ncbi:Hypothetical predicted protein, partial [Pelobates cultripes]